MKSSKWTTSNGSAGWCPLENLQSPAKVFFLHNRKDIVILLLMAGHKPINPVAIFNSFPPNSRRPTGAGCSSTVILTHYSCLFPSRLPTKHPLCPSWQSLMFAVRFIMFYREITLNFPVLMGEQYLWAFTLSLTLASKPLELWQSGNWSWTYRQHFNWSHVNIRQVKNDEITTHSNLI